MNEQPGTAAPWGDHLLPDRGETTRFDIGPLTLWVRRIENEVWVAYHRPTEEPTPEGTELPSSAEWQRWAFEHHPTALRLLPALPDRVLVVKTEQPFTLLRRASARIFMRVPVWVRVQAVIGDGSAALTMTEIPTEVFSDTWWGDFMEGQIAYWLTTKARREIRDEMFEPNLVVAVLQLRNRSSDDLAVEKLALRVEHLSIYELDGRLWAEETGVDYQGEALGSDIRMDDRAPIEAKGAREITPARAQARGFRARTFAKLRALSTFGFSQ